MCDWFSSSTGFEAIRSELTSGRGEDMSFLMRRDS